MPLCLFLPALHLNKKSILSYIDVVKYSRFSLIFFYHDDLEYNRKYITFRLSKYKLDPIFYQKPTSILNIEVFFNLKKCLQTHTNKNKYLLIIIKPKTALLKV